MSRRILVAQDEASQGMHVPVAATRGGGFAIKLSGPLQPNIVIDAAPVPSGAQRSTETGAAEDELAKADDFAPPAGRGRVVVTGRILRAQPVDRIPLRLSIGSPQGEWLATRALSVMCAAPSTSFPLTGAFLRSDEGEAVPPLGPTGGLEGPLARGSFIELQGVHASERMLFCLPALSPRLVIDRSDVVELACEVCHIDLAERRVTLLYRAHATPETPSAVVLLFDDGSIERASDLAFAVEPGVAREEPDPAELVAARLEDGPSLPFDVYARAATLLMEPRVDRRAVLDAVGLTEDRWIAEESAWLERIGNEAMDGDPSLAIAYGEILSAERAALAEPDEGRTLEEYARIRAELERAGDPEQVLASHRLTLPAWFRLDEHWEAQIENEPELESRLAALLVAEHARLDERADRVAEERA